VADSPAALDGTSWTIVEIAGEAIRGDSYFLDFGPDRIVGFAGCNRFSGHYTTAGNRIRVDRFMSTRKACAEPAMGRERRAWRILGGPARISRPGRNLMMLTGNGGAIRLRRKV
jgi:heat shock protein HslJ